MQKIEPSIKNRLGEKLDTWVEIPEVQVKASVIMVHGFGTDKHETAGYFDDISEALINDNYRVIRFDFSGYGNSEGRQEDACYTKHVEDLQAIISYVTSNYNGSVYIFAQSMGCFVTALAQQREIVKTIMTGIPNSNPQIIIDRVMKRFGSRPGAKLNLEGISELPRSTGKIQRIGARFWQDIRNLNPIDEIREYSKKTKLLIIHWENDEIIGKDYLNGYDAIPTVQSFWLSGNHSVSNLEDRSNFIKDMLDFYNK